MSIVRVLLADTSAALRRSMESVISAQPDLVVIGTSTGTVDVLLRAAQADVVVIQTASAQLPPLADLIVEEYPRIGVVAIDPDEGVASVHQLRPHTERGRLGEESDIVAAIRRAASPDIQRVDSGASSAIQEPS